MTLSDNIADREFDKFRETSEGVVSVNVAPLDEVSIAVGLRDGYKVLNKFGRNPDIDTAANEDVWGGGGVYTGFPVSANELVTIKSTSVNDTAAGSGARTVRMSGLDADGFEQEEDLILNGTTLVDSVNVYSRVNRAFVLTSGSNNQAFNAGSIIVAGKTTTANIFVIVVAGLNQSTIGAYTIPAGKTGLITNLDVSIKRSSSSTIDGAIWAREMGKSPRFVSIFSASQDGPYTKIFLGGLVFPARTDLSIRITASSANNTEVTTEFGIMLIDN